MASYNCSDANNSAYGAGNYSTCDATSSVGAPNTGDFATFVTSAAPSIMLPLAVLILLSAIVMIVKRRTQKSSQEQQ